MFARCISVFVALILVLSMLSLLLAKARIGDGVTCVDLKVLNVPDMNGPLGPGLIKKYPAVAGYL
jgi:hypothetical protein